MPYVELDGLSRFDWKLKNFAYSECAGPDMANWQRTAAAGAVSFLPVSEMPLDLVVNFAFTETGPASGTKGPDNPSTITGVTQAKVTRCGKNLFKTPFQTSNTITLNYVTFTIDNEHGTITVNGTATGRDATIYVSGLTVHPRLVAGKTYTMSGCPSGGSTATYFLDANRYNLDGSYGSGLAADTGSGATWTYANSDWFPVCPITIKNGTTVSNLVFRPQLELGSAATSFEPYEGADYTVNLGGTFYGGNVDLSAGTMTVTQFGETFGVMPSSRVFVGGVQTNTVAFDIVGENRNTGNTSQGTHVSNRFEFEQNNNDYEHFRATGSTSTGSLSLRFFINKSRLDLSSAVDPSNPTNSEWIQAFLSWLASNHIFVVCDLFSPQTVTLTPLQIYSLSQPDPYTPRINTVYSDQVSVQVGYPKSPQASQTELTNAIVSLGGNV